MSVINQMLQELEQRRADGGAGAAQVRAARRHDGPGVARWISLILAVAAAGGVAYWILGGSGRISIKHPVPVVAAPPSPPAPAPQPAQALSRPQPLPQVLQLAGELGQLPDPGKKTAPATQSFAPETAPAPAMAVKPKPAAQVPKPPVTEEAPPLPEAINKEIRQPSPQQRAENAYRQAYASLQQGRMGEAEDGMRQALQHDPRHAAARQALAALLVETRHFDRAEQLLQQGLELLPGQTGFAMTLARLQVERGDVAAALATLQRNPPSGEGAEYHGFMAALLQRSERHKEAIEHYQRALRSNPGSGPWLLGLGISLQADSQPARAADAFRRARAGGGLSAELQAFAEQRLKQLQ